MKPTPLLLFLVVSNVSFAVATERESLLDGETVSLEPTHERVSLESFNCESNTGSSFLNRVCYDRDSQTVLISLNEKYHKLCGVPQHIIANWVASDSMGRYYFNRVKGRFDC